jgi:hypothetical protein
VAAFERAITPVTVHLGFRADLALDDLLSGSGLDVVEVQKVNRPRLWSLVICRR